jgi:hypothetical protein
MPRKVLVILALVMSAGSASATVLRAATLDELAKSAAVIFHGRVAEVDDAIGAFRTRVRLDVLTPVKGLTPDTKTFVLELPGGRVDDKEMRIPGMPHFAPGDEVVLILEQTERGYALAGMGQGVFRVARQAGEVRVVRELGGALLLDRNNKPGELSRAPSTLDALLAALRQAVAQ